jgi:predicted nucleic acid-binding protein
VIVADTGAIVALIDADDRHHAVLLELFERDPDWVLPWAILPEIDYLLTNHVGPDVERAFLRDLAEGRWAVEWGQETDLTRARELCERYLDLHLGFVDGVVATVAERLGASEIATLDERHFGVMEIRGRPKLYPRDL